MYFTVNGKPKPQERHKHARAGNFIKTYDPSKKDKQDFLIQVREFAPKQPLSGELRMILVFYMPRPKNHFRTGKYKNELKPISPLYHTNVPDADNLAKFVMDALSGVFYEDDKQIAQLKVEKMYSRNPRTEIHIEFI